MKLFWYLAVLFLFSSLYLTDQFNHIGNILISVLILLFIPLIIISKKDEFKVNSPSLFLMLIYLLICSMSALYNSDLKLILSAVVFFALYIAAFIFAPSLNLDINKVVFRAILISNIPIILVPILVSGFNSVPYRGIFYNPNSFGTVASTLFAVLFVNFLANLEDFISGKRIVRKIMVKVMLLFFIMFLVIMSGSRTSTLSAVGVILSGMFFVTIHLIKEKKFGSFIVKGTFFSLLSIGLITALVKLTPFYQYLYLNILYKFERKAGNGDVLSERGYVWSQTIKEAGIFGNGSSYFTSDTVAGAHNTYISILGENGWPALIVFIVILISLLIKSFKYAISKTTDRYKYLPLMLVVSFSILSVGEGMMFKLSMMSMFFSLGSTIDISHKKEELKANVSKVKLKRKRIVW